MDTSRYTPGHCPRCGQSLPEDTPEGLCAACLFEAGAATLTANSLGDSTPFSLEVPRLASGQTWGAYRIGRLLGRGGMGEVYESEHVESGRRIALKVLRNRLQTTDLRARFLREGQLAASISHPHTVYIFGSEEISGMPVISMELLPGGTLKDRVAARGPLPPSEAVTAILDIIGGLDAAHAAGILHRDIKPSNCFLDAEGAVKVGDFGLSISTLARDASNQLTSSAFQGTPQFAPPEQLRGEPIDVRADIYAVGATLYYLLTGKAPFDAPNLRDLVTRVTTEPAKSPRTIRPEIPAGLASIVLRCLEKAPQQRPASYSALADALRPFSSTDDVPARPGPRIVANVVDTFIVSAAVSFWLLPTTLLVVTESMTANLWLGFMSIPYFFFLERLWGTTPGKRLFGLFVTSTKGPSSSLSIALRTLLFCGPQLLLMLFMANTERFAVDPIPVDYTYSSLVWPLLGVVLMLAMFSLARRHNGWAGIHELVSHTRVIARLSAAHPREGRPAELAPTLAGFVQTTGGKVLGPFALLHEEEQNLIVGFDPVLRRRVWIHTVPPGTPPISAVRRDVGRVERLFWLMGRRSEIENWDAFEAPDGESFVTRRNADMTWPVLKLWLMDLVRELRVGSADGSLPTLGLERLWIRSDQRLVLLDFPAPGSSETESTASEPGSSPETLLSAVARSALAALGSVEAQVRSLPLSARVFLNRLSSAGALTLEETQKMLKEVSHRPDRVQRWRRSVPVGLAAAPIVFLLVAALILAASLFTMLQQIGQTVPLLDALQSPTPVAGSRLGDPKVREAFEKYTVGTQGAVLTSDAFWNGPFMTLMRDGTPQIGEDYRTAQEITARHRFVTPEEIASAKPIVEAELQLRGTLPKEYSKADLMSAMSQFVLWMNMPAILVFSLISSIVIPGGVLMRSAGLAVVTRDGTEIGRLRSLVRALVTWSPAIAWVTPFFAERWTLVTSQAAEGFPELSLGFTIPTLGILVAGAIWAIVQPSRGFQDRIVGTFIVPR